MKIKRPDIGLKLLPSQVFFHYVLVPILENEDGDQTVQSHGHTAASATSDVCAGVTVQISSTTFINFSIFTK